MTDSQRLEAFEKMLSDVQNRYREADDKMKRLIKSEIVKTPTDKEKEVRYNEDNNLFVGRSLQEE